MEIVLRKFSIFQQSIVVILNVSQAIGCKIKHDPAAGGVLDKGHYKFFFLAVRLKYLMKSS